MKNQRMVTERGGNTLTGIGTLLILLGVLVAIPYTVYVQSFSGQEVGRYPLATQEALGDGATT